MSSDASDSRWETLTTYLTAVVRGPNEARLRATWRFLLAWPLFKLVGALVDLVTPVLGVSGMIPSGPLQGIMLILILLVWARVIDRRPLSEYGVSVSRSWLVDLLVGFAVVVVVWSGWHALAASVGWMQIKPAMTAPQESPLYGFIGTLVSVAINSWVQDMIFFAIILQSAAEGFRSRGLDPARAVIGGWLVGILFFTVIHGMPGPIDVLAHMVGGAVYGLLYVHTGVLALTVGVHWGASYVTMIFASPSMARQFPSWFQVTDALPGTRGLVASSVLHVLTYLVLVGWLRWRRGGVTIETRLAEWTERRDGLLGPDSPVLGG